MMKYVNSRVVINQSVLNQITKAATTALEMTGDYVHGEIVTAQVIPFETGTLQNEGTYVNKKDSKQGSVKIVSSEPYARRLYFHPEYNFKKDNNPNAKGKWLEDWSEKGKYAKEVIQAYTMFFKQQGGF